MHVIDRHGDGTPRLIVYTDPLSNPFNLPKWKPAESPPDVDPLPAPTVVAERPPSLIQKVINFAGAVLNHVISGKRADPKQIEARIEICNKCEYQKPEGICSICSCVLRLKTAMAEQSCPLKPPKWGPVTSQEKLAEPKVSRPCCGG